MDRIIFHRSPTSCVCLILYQIVCLRLYVSNLSINCVFQFCRIFVLSMGVLLRGSYIFFLNIYFYFCMSNCVF